MEKNETVQSKVDEAIDILDSCFYSMAVQQVHDESISMMEESLLEIFDRVNIREVETEDY